MKRNFRRVTALLLAIVIFVITSTIAIAEITTDPNLDSAISLSTSTSSSISLGLSLFERVIYALSAIFGAGSIFAIYLAYLSEAGGSELKACDEIRFQAGSNQAYINLMNKFPDVKEMCAKFGLETLPEPRRG
jgi:hypothetical protein